MDAETLKKFKGLIEGEIDGIGRELKANEEDSATVQLDTSIGRLARMDAMQSQQMALELRRRQQSRLQRLEQALKNVANGTYGQCKKCRQPIAEERLEYQLDALWCVKCAEG